MVAFVLVGASGKGLCNRLIYKGVCLIGLDLVPLLPSSHIKPGVGCDSDEERLDVFNGLLLAPHLDVLCDGDRISFSEIACTSRQLV